LYRKNPFFSTILGNKNAKNNFPLKRRNGSLEINNKNTEDVAWNIEAKRYDFLYAEKKNETRLKS
jgi:hypothetical protein